MRAGKGTRESAGILRRYRWGTSFFPRLTERGHIMNRSRRIAALGVLAMACAPVTARATIIFSDDFDAGTSISRYDGYAQDNDTAAETPGAIADLSNPGAAGYDVG